MTAATAVAPVERPPLERIARVVAWTAWVVGAALRVWQLVLSARIPTDGVPLAWGVGLEGVGSAAVFGFAQATVGALIVSRRPRNLIAWILVASGVFQGSLGAATAWSSLAFAEGVRGPAIQVATVASIGIQAVPLTVIALVLLIFPDGRLPSRRWWAVVALALAGCVLRAAEVSWGPSDVFLVPSMGNPYVAPFGLGPAVRAAYEVGLGYRILQVAVALASISLWFRYRRADRQTALQLRWFFAAACAMGVLAVPFAYVNVFVPRTDRTVEWTISLLFLSFALPSLAIFEAISRRRLYEIDRIVNRAVLYGGLTALLAGLFTAGVGVAQRLFVLVTGERSDAALVLTTFVVATVYQPIRRSLETRVDRRFKYDRARFGAYRDEIDRVLAVVEPGRAAHRLCTEAVRELDAIGAAVVAPDGRLVAHAGHWPVEAAVEVPFGAGDAGWLRVGPRRDGHPHDPVAVAELEELSRLVELAARPLAERAAEPAAAPAGPGRRRVAR